MMTEGASAPPRFDPTTVNPTMPMHHDIKPKATTTEEKKGEKEQRKDDSCFTTMNHFYTQTWYPIDVVDTRVELLAPHQKAHHPTELRTCTLPDPTTNSFSVLATFHQTFTTVTEPTAPKPTAVTDPTGTSAKGCTVTEPNVTQPTVNNSTVLLHTASKSTVTNPTVTNPTVTNPTVLKSTVTYPTVLNHTVTTTTVPQSTVGATLKTPTDLTMTYLNLTDASYYLNQYTMMTLYKFFPHYSHPPYPGKCEQ
jgi:hypothetical protein